MASALFRAVNLGGRGAIVAVAGARGVSIAGARRGMAYKGFKKNFYVEEWNGKRELAHTTFRFTRSNSAALFVGLGLLPGVMFVFIKDDLEKKDLQKQGFTNKYI